MCLHNVRVCVFVHVLSLPNALNELMRIGVIIKSRIAILDEPLVIILFCICSQVLSPCLLALALSIYHSATIHPPVLSGRARPYELVFCFSSPNCRLESTILNF